MKPTRGSDGPSSAHTFNKTREQSPVKLGHTLGEEMLHTGMFNNNIKKKKFKHSTRSTYISQVEQ